MSNIVSVIIPVYNVERYVERCIKSVISQDYKDLEIILVDDGSLDKSGDICDYYSNMDSRIKVIHKKNEGLGEARNTALDIIKGDYIFFIDSDDYIYPGIIKKLVENSLLYDSDIVCCGYQSGKKKYYCGGNIEIYEKLEATKKALKNDGIDVNAVCKLYKKQLFESIRYPNCAYEVVPVTYKVILKANKIVNIGALGYYIEKREGSITRSAFGKNNLLYINMTYDVYMDVKKNIPQLEDSAYVFYLNSVIGMAERASESKVSDQNIEYKEVIKQFNDNYRKIVTNKAITIRKKIIAIFIKCKVYGIIKRIYRKI